jgi:DNA-binding transcriptional LysR family regulator
MGHSIMDRHQRARRRLKLRHLEILLAVADTGSMAKAATRLAVTQPAISRAIADVEHTLGVPLFERSTQGVELTQYGRALLKRGVAAFDEIEQGVKDIEFLADPTAGEVRLSTGAGISEGIVLAVINRLSRQYPRIVFHVAIAQATALFDQLRDRSSEFGFGVWWAEVARAEDIHFEALFEEPMVVVAGADNPWVRRRKIQLAELVNEPWAWPPPPSLYDTLVVGAFRASRLTPPRPTVYTHALNVRIGLVATGPLLAVVPAGVVSSPEKYPSIRKLPVELPTAQRQIGIVTLKNRTLSPLAQRFIDCARELAKPLAKHRETTKSAQHVRQEPR